MNRITIIFLGSLCMLLLCSGVKRIEKAPALTITPEKLQLFVNQHTDPYTLKVAYTLNIPAGFIPSCARLIYQPYFLTERHRYDLTPLVVSGRENLRQEKRLETLTGKLPEFPDALHLMTTGDGMKIKLSQTIPFEVWMAEAKLRADVALEACDRERQIEVLTLADGVIWFPLAPGPALVKYVKESEKVQKIADFWFLYPAGQYVFDRAYAGNAERMQQMVSLIDSLQNDSSIHLKEIVITGSSSPFGNQTYNDRLARQRAERMRLWFIERKGLDSNLIKLKVVGEDWQGFRKLTGQSEMPNKAAVMHILDGKYTNAQRETLLRQLPQYEYIRSHLFPELQKVTCTFHFTHQEEVTKIVPE